MSNAYLGAQKVICIAKSGRHTGKVVFKITVFGINA
jgi:hypothetical protein